MLFTGIMIGISVGCLAAAAALHKRQEVLLLTQATDADAIVPNLLQKAVDKSTSNDFDGAVNLVRRAIEYLEHMPKGNDYPQQIAATLQAMFDHAIERCLVNGNDGAQRLRRIIDLGREMPGSNSAELNAAQAESIIDVAFQCTGRQEFEACAKILWVAEKLHYRQYDNQEASDGVFLRRITDGAMSADNDCALRVLLSARSQMGLKVGHEASIYFLQAILTRQPFWVLFGSYRFANQSQFLLGKMANLRDNHGVPEHLSAAFESHIKPMSEWTSVPANAAEVGFSKQIDAIADLATNGWVREASSLESLGSYANAKQRELFMRALEIKEERLGQNHPLLCRTLVLLGNRAYYDRQNISRNYGDDPNKIADSSKFFYERAADIMRQAASNQHPQLCQLIKDCANLCADGEMRNTYLDLALSLAEASFDKKDPAMVDFLAGKVQASRHGEGEEYLERLVDILGNGNCPPTLDMSRVLAVANNQFKKHEYALAAKLYTYLESLNKPLPWRTRIRKYFNSNPHDIDFQQITEKRLICQKAMLDAGS